MNKAKKVYELWNKVDDYTSDEITFLKKHLRKNLKVYYGFYTKISSKKKQIVFLYDNMPFQSRRTGVENNWEIISTREITNREIEEYINFYFKKEFKRFLVFYYQNIDKLVYDDKRLDAVTPDKFIDECLKRNYTGTYQIKIELQ